MSESSRSHFFSVVRRFVGVAIAGAFPAAVIDVLRGTARAEDAVSAGSVVCAVTASLGFYGMAAIAIGLTCGVVFGSTRVALPEDFAVRLRRRLHDDESADTSAAAALFAAGAAAVLLAALVFIYAHGFGFEMASKRNGALSTAMVAAAALPLCLLAGFPCYLVLRPVARLLPRPRALFALGSMAAVAVLGVGGAVLSVDWRVIDFGPFVALAIFVVLAAGHYLVWRTKEATALWLRVPSRLRGVPLAGSMVLIPVLVALSLNGLERNPRALALIAEETSGARSLLRIARHLSDRDHDGYSSVLGGADCNDHNPNVHPGALEEPGNGIDEDCSEGDAVPTTVTDEARTANQNTAIAPGVPNPDGAALEDSGVAARPSPIVAAATPPVPMADGSAFIGNLVIITIDTLRADRLNPKTMPHLDALAKNSVVFTHAYAQAPNTPRSFPSFLTGRFPSQVRFSRGFANFSPLVPENLTFFEVLKQAGYYTVGEFSHFYMDPRFGIGQGFDEWNNEGALTLHDSNTDSAAPRITARVVKKLQKLAASKKRFALWTHFFEPHSRYMEHPEFPAHGTGMASLEGKYDGEVSFVDLHVQKVLDALKAAGLEGNTAVIVFSDHGEAFGEHRVGGELMYFHGQTLYDELLRVPLVIHVPGRAARTVEEQVMLLDLAPTLFDLIGVPKPPAFQGRSLAPALLGAPLQPLSVYAEMLPEPSWNHSWRAIVEGHTKLIYKISENSLELYDVAGDPKEKHNLAFEQVDTAKRLKQSLVKWMQAAPHG